MKKILAVLLALGISTTVAFAEVPVTVVKNGETVVCDVESFQGETEIMIPLRAVFEAMDSHIRWESELRTIMIARQKNDELLILALQIGSDKAFINSDSVTMSTPAIISQNRTFIPLSFVTDNFGGELIWDETAKTLTIVNE